MTQNKIFIASDGIIHAVQDGITLCLQHALYTTPKNDKQVNCKNCIKKAQILLINLEEESKPLNKENSKQAFSKLRAYEESGLTPEEVKKLADLKREGKLFIRR